MAARARAGRRDLSPREATSPPPSLPSASRWLGLRFTIGALLVALGVVLWIRTGAPAFGLISGLGVVIAYVGAEPWLERWRNR